MHNFKTRQLAAGKHGKRLKHIFPDKFKRCRAGRVPAVPIPEAHAAPYPGLNGAYDQISRSAADTPLGLQTKTHRTTICLQLAGDNFNQRAFSAAVGTVNTNPLSRAHQAGNSPQNRHAIELLWISVNLSASSARNPASSILHKISVPCRGRIGDIHPFQSYARQPLLCVACSVAQER